MIGEKNTGARADSQRIPIHAGRISIVKRAVIDVTVSNAMGLHARPASLLVRTASRFHSDVSLVKDGEPVNCKSVLALMMLSAGMGTPLQIIAEGEDAEEAAGAVEKLFLDKFGEE